MPEDALTRLDWTLRVSRRARYARLQVRPFGGLEIVVPPRFPRAEVGPFVARHEDWIRRQLGRQARARDAVRPPQRIDLALDGSSTPVIYAQSLRGTTGDLFAPVPAGITVDAADLDGQLRELRAWVRQRARALLPPRLERLAARTGLDYARVGIRSQKTRWGSCSRRGHISLNDQLVFVPPATADYLMIHELCHTRHLDHSPAFWRLVERHCPAYREHDARLGRSREIVPDWFLLDLYS